MARAKRSKAKTRFHRCARCRSPIPVGYAVCGSCDYNIEKDSVERFMRRAKNMFPGSHEI